MEVGYGTKAPVDKGTSRCQETVCICRPPDTPAVDRLPLCQQNETCLCGGGFSPEAFKYRGIVCAKIFENLHSRFALWLVVSLITTQTNQPRDCADFQCLQPATLPLYLNALLSPLLGPQKSLWAF